MVDAPHFRYEPALMVTNVAITPISNRKEPPHRMLLQSSLDLVESLSYGRLLFTGDFLEPRHEPLESSLGPQECDPPCLQPLDTAGSVEFGKGSGLELFDFFQHGR